VNIILFGYPKTGKTTLFNLLTGAAEGPGAHEDGRKDSNVRCRPLPDPRLDALAALTPEKKKVPAAVDITDLVGISFGEVKDCAFLSALRRADGLIHVVRGFPDDSNPHPRGRIDPAGDIRTMEEELVLADLGLVLSRIERLAKDLKKKKDPEWEKELELLEKLRPLLEEGRRLETCDLSPAEEKLIGGYCFLSRKPLLHAINVDEKDAARMDGPGDPFGLASRADEVLAFCGSIENEFLGLPEDEKKAFMDCYGLREPSAGRFFRKLPGVLGVLSFYTIGKDEVRAWMIGRGSTAVKAAGAIHSDIEKGFIRAEVIPQENLLQFGSFARAREAGAIRLEGRDYVVRDGDVLYFRFAQ
jgi:ribosome-binding ATPase